MLKVFKVSLEIKKNFSNINRKKRVQKNQGEK